MLLLVVVVLDEIKALLVGVTAVLVSAGTSFSLFHSGMEPCAQRAVFVIRWKGPTHPIGSRNWFKDWKPIESIPFFRSFHSSFWNDLLRICLWRFPHEACGMPCWKVVDRFRAAGLWNLATRGSCADMPCRGMLGWKNPERQSSMKLKKLLQALHPSPPYNKIIAWLLNSWTAPMEVMERKRSAIMVGQAPMAW